jgi:hypothetical protein
LKPSAKDDNDIIEIFDNYELGAKQEFANNNFWRAPDQYDISELMQDL